ncbi:MAG: hypothetical protein II625_06395 [Bacilli bacterium]|nr:hypothetical protein [Bacilli bacterium]
MKEKIFDRILLIISILVVIGVLYLGYVLLHSVNPKRQIKSDIKEILRDYDISNGSRISIKIHSKTSNNTKISYNVVLDSDKYDDLDKDTQLEIIKYIKKLSFKGNGNKYSINEVIINSNDNVYTYNNVFKKNDELYSVNDIKESTIDKIKDKWNELTK